jgi:hypothetical protein
MEVKFTEELHTNNSGAPQTKLPVRCDLLPADVILQVSQVLGEAAEKYGEENWKKIESHDHINHALTHVLRFLSGDRSEPHILHAVCRLMFVQYLINKNDTR